jgi:hypothetical protein
VQRVDLAELRLELSGLDDEVPREVEERDVALLDVDALVREGEEQVRARVRVDDRLERDLRLLELERLVGTTGLCPAVARKLPMTAIAGLKNVGLTGFGENTLDSGRVPARAEASPAEPGSAPAGARSG